MKAENSNFSSSKYWKYGCHCMFLGEKSVKAMGQGSPRDLLDKTCKMYKECHKCVRDKFGDTCTGELFDYQYYIGSYDQLLCLDEGLYVILFIALSSVRSLVTSMTHRVYES